MPKWFSFTVEIYDRMPGQAKYVLLENGRTHTKETKKGLLESISALLMLADINKGR